MDKYGLAMEIVDALSNQGYFDCDAEYFDMVNTVNAVLEGALGDDDD